MLSLAQQLNLLDLYDEEIANALDTHYDKLGNISKLISSDQWEELSARAGASDEKSHFGTTLWKQLRSSPMKNVLYEEVCAFLRRLLALHSDGAINLHNLKKILTVSPTLLDLLDVELFLDFASSIKAFKKLATQLRLRLRTRDISDASAKKHILRHFPLLCAYSTEHILFGVCKCSKEGAQWVKSRYPNFMAEYDLACEDERMPRGLYFIVEPDEDIGTALDNADKLGVDAPNAFDVRFSRIPQAHLRSCVLGLSREVPLTLRDYQWELVREACEGKNSVICAPTGSGKTVVAAYIIRQHILSRTMAQKNFKASLLRCPNRCLAEQQRQLLNTYLEHCAKVRSLIVNLLEPNLLDAEEQVRQDFSLSMFSMLVFDEAHHATESHPYNVILRDHYHVMKETGIGGKLVPQIVGLTASLGVGGSSTKDLENALKHTVGLCANLDACAISRVRKNVQQMKDFTADSGDG
ncbi:Protein DRH-1 [Aphelenchoides avenae]|nr:Protein DRH-1 [Aphelenchus avenae]